MIAYLIGRPLHIGLQRCVLLTNGVGYDIHIGAQTSRQLLDKDQVELFITTVVREDDFSLFGFLQREQKEVFGLLTGVSGVGPKTALNIVDFGPSEVVQAVQNADVNFFSAVPRVGKKLAQKIVIELKSKLGSLKDLDLTPLSSVEQELCDALMGLGFKETEIQGVVKEFDLTEMSVESALTKALQLLGQRHVNKKIK